MAAAARKAGGGKAGELAKKGQGFAGAMKSIQTNWELFSNEISEKSAPAFDKLSKIILRLGSNANAGLWADRIAAGLSWAVDMLEAAVPYLERLINDSKSWDMKPFKDLGDSMLKFMKNPQNIELVSKMFGDMKTAAGDLAYVTRILFDMGNASNRSAADLALLGLAFRIMLGPIGLLLTLRDLLNEIATTIDIVIGKLSGLAGKGSLGVFGGVPQMRAVSPGDLGGISSLMNSVVNSSSGPKTSAAAGHISINVSATGGSGDPQELAWKIAREVKTQLKNATASIGV